MSIVLKVKDALELLKEFNEDDDLMIQVNSDDYSEGNVSASVAMVRAITENKENNSVLLVG